MRIAVLDVYHEFHFEVLKKLRERTGCEYVYAVTGTRQNFHGNAEHIDQMMQELFGSSTILDPVSRFLFPENLSKLVTENWVLDQDFLAGAHDVESYFLRLTDRGAAFHLPVHIRRQYYLILANYFRKILLDTRPDVLLTFDTPHSFSSHTFYRLAHRSGVHSVRLEHHFIENHSLLLSWQLPSIPDAFAKSNSTSELHNMLSPELKQDFAVYSSYIGAANKRESRKLISGASSSSILRLAFRFLKKGSANIIMGLFPYFFKKELLHFTSLNGIKSRLWYRIIINVRLFRLLKLNLHYNRIAIHPDLSRDYVFFGMHMQPEKTSQPLGGEFDHQLLPIVLLSRSLPEGWMLYVKDHPNQFNERKIPNANYRNALFYDTVLRLPNVRFVSLDVSSSELIRNARVVSTLTGTMGWEGLRQGKPVIAFGETYYRPCRAVRSPGSVSECRDAIRELSTMDAAAVERELMRYLAFFEQEGYLVRASNWEAKMAHSSLSREQQVDNLTAGIIKQLSKNTFKE